MTFSRKILLLRACSSFFLVSYIILTRIFQSARKRRLQISLTVDARFSKFERYISQILPMLTGLLKVIFHLYLNALSFESHWRP